MDLRAANKQVLEALIKAGAFDKLGGGRAQMMAGLEGAMENGASLQADKQKGQMSFFGQMAGGNDYSQDHERLPTVAPGGDFRLGLGVEQSIKCARNTKFAERRSPLVIWAVAPHGHGCNP